MKDIDFDELDRAVSSVLGQTAPSKEDSTEKQVVPAPAGAKTADADPVKQAVPLATDTQPAASSGAVGPLAPKRRGRFMDVMHPSATMLPSSSAENAKPALTEHETTTLQPLSPTPVEEEKPAPTSDLAVVEPIIEQPSEPIAELDESQTLIGAEPAPMENPIEEVKTPATSDNSDVEQDKGADAEPALDGNLDNVVDTNDTGATENEPSIDESTQSSLTSSIPQETPFLTDTKVDKRPLGGFGATADDGGSGAVGVPDDTKTSPAMALPRELQSDVVEVESSHDDSAPAAGSAPLFATDVSVSPEPQDDGRVEGHPLFDTTTYHEPIAAAHESATPVWVKWVLGLAVCLVLGAGVGYFLFTAGL